MGGAWREALDGTGTGNGHPLGPFLHAELAREFGRLHLVLGHMKQLDAERHVAHLEPLLAVDAPELLVVGRDPLAGEQDHRPAPTEAASLAG